MKEKLEKYSKNISYLKKNSAKVSSTLAKNGWFFYKLHDFSKSPQMENLGRSGRARKTGFSVFRGHILKQIACRQTLKNDIKIVIVPRVGGGGEALEY